ncbi:hypothetical protein ACFXNW_14200 [Nocardia sp. NPDC059180]|uniref:hypothetical protein n=1 Tax=Nocardia sp. NPDC059180 TaxID=3346761 RepID=UPI0036B234D7
MVGRSCALCGGTNNVTREHVYPSWFLKRWDATAAVDGPFSTKINGVELLRRDGAIATNPRIGRVMLDLCQSANGCLNTAFELPAKDPVRRLLDEGSPLLSPDEVHHLARWMVKTLLLAAHPASEHTAFASRRVNKKNTNSPWLDYSKKIADALEAGRLPDDATLWVAVTGPNGQPDPDYEPVYLRHTTRADDEGGTGHVRTTGFNLLGGDRMVLFQLVHHPLHDLTHPFRGTGTVTQLWPNAPAALDLSTHRLLDHATRLSHVFLESGFSQGLRAGERSVGNGLPWMQWNP